VDAGAVHVATIAILEVVRPNQVFVAVTSQTPDLHSVIESWDIYWRRASDNTAYTSGGSGHPLVLAFWSEYFRGIRNRHGKPKIIDIASGNGAVVQCAEIAFDGTLPEFTCLDVSGAAIKTLETRFPSVRGVVADAAAIPLESDSYQFATSQFGIEYAGLEALDELMRLLGDSGELALLMHYRDGAIHRQCRANLDAISQMQAARFIPHCLDTFEAGFLAMRGGDREPYRSAGRALGSAIRAVEYIMMSQGTEIADGVIVRLYRDVRSIHEQLSRYELSDIRRWLESMQEEIDAYAGRMAAMCDVAIDQATFGHLCQRLIDAGFDVSRGEPLTGPRDPCPLAWSLIARKH
jgi:SAM-dependent methyltransferase